MTSPARGRPRRYDDDTERRLLLDAAMELLRTHGYGDFGVADVLASTHLSTRSFYRHFESKEALHVALLHREIASVTRQLTRVVEAAEDPVAGVEAWLDAILHTFLDQELASRSSAFTAPAAIAGSTLTEEMEQVRDDLCRPLASAIRRGRVAGAIVSPDPDQDARAVYGLVTACAPTGLDRETVRGQVIRFAWPALGLTEHAGG